jgi:hypothetical protein
MPLWFTYGLTLIAFAIHLGVSKASRTPRRAVETLLLYQFVFVVAVGGTMAFLGHVFMPDKIAESIGWPTGSPFQYEVGIADGAFGMLGWICIFKRGLFWWATGLAWSFFMVGDAIGHVMRLVQDDDFAPGNAGMWLPEFVIAAVLITSLIVWKVLTDRENAAAAQAAAALQPQPSPAPIP